MGTRARSIVAWVSTDPIARMQMSTIITSSIFLGILSMLASATIFFLLRNGIHRRSRRVMLLSVAVLYIAACIHFTVCLSSYVNLYSLVLVYLPTTNWGEAVQVRQSQISTATLTINIFVGDSIVWWRAYVLWARNYYVRCCCAIILAATLALGSVATHNSGILNVGFILNHGPQLYALDRFGAACFCLSLTSNVTATSLIYYKAREHRNVMKHTLSGSGSNSSQTVKILLLVIESGIGYCLLWLLVVTVELYDTILHGNIPGWFLYCGYIFLRGVMVYLVAGYPMLIITLVNLNRSPIDEMISESSSMRFADPDGVFPAEDSVP